MNAATAHLAAVQNIILAIATGPGLQSRSSSGLQAGMNLNKQYVSVE